MCKGLSNRQTLFFILYGSLDDVVSTRLSRERGIVQHLIDGASASSFRNFLINYSCSKRQVFQLIVLFLVFTLLIV